MKRTRRKTRWRFNRSSRRRTSGRNFKSRQRAVALPGLFHEVRRNRLSPAAEEFRRTMKSTNQYQKNRLAGACTLYFSEIMS